jgi:hypothetical protein
MTPTMTTTPRPPDAANGDALTLQRVVVPSVDPELVFDVEAHAGRITRLDAVGRASEHPGALELWPGYVESHAHVGLPANFDDTLDDPRVLALQYIYHGVTHVVDMFGFPLAQAGWEAGREASSLPYPEIVHCGYAATSLVDVHGRTGHGVEFPAPVYMLGVADDLEIVIRANRERGATFLKVMFTEGMEEPDGEIRFSRLSGTLLGDVARVAAAHGVTCVLDCNTRAEVQQAYSYGFRLFAHSVRDVELSASDWDALEGARFVSTLAGLRPLVMDSQAFLREYSRPGFAETQDVANLAAVADLEQSFGVQLNRQDTRLAALEHMRRNCLAALDRGALLVGTDCGNLGTFHGYSLMSELQQLAGDGPDAPDLRRRLRELVTVGGLRFFGEFSGRSVPEQPIAVGEAATFNLLAPIERAGEFATLPKLTVIDGVVIDRNAIVGEIDALRAPARGKVIR